MVTHCDEKVKEQFTPLLHLHLHRATPLESVSAADDEGKVVCSELGVSVGSMSICPSSRGEDGRYLDAGLKALFAESKAFQIVETIAVGSAAVETVSKDGLAKVKRVTIYYMTVSFKSVPPTTWW